MNTLLQHRSFIRSNLLMLVGVCLCFYFSYHVFQGNRGFVRLLMLRSEVSTLSHDYEEARAQRQAIEQKVIAMRPGSVSRDLLEERVRIVLGYRHPDEIAIRATK